MTLVASASTSQAAIVRPLAQGPTASKTHVVFTYGGFLWRVPRDGGRAEQLTKIGDEGRAYFSPDGSQIAFTSRVDGNRDVYVMSAEGGSPRRLTWHAGGDVVLGWSPDGQNILFKTTRDSFATFHRLYTVPAAGGVQQALPMWRGEAGALSPDGSRLAYVPVAKWQKEWKRYRGGQTTPIHLIDLRTLEVVTTPRDNSNDSEPVWIGDRVYFLSDRDGPTTLFAYDVRDRSVRRLIDNPGLDLKTLTAGPGVLAYEQFGDIYLYDLATGRSKRVDVTVDDDLPALRPGKVRLRNAVEAVALAPDGSATAFEARGDIVVVDKAGARNLTATPGVAERSPAFAPDGLQVAYFSDESGEYALHIRRVDGKGRVHKIALGDRPSFFERIVWSPDGRKLAFEDKHLNLWWVGLKDGRLRKVATDLIDATPHDFSPAWSPDSNWLAYSKGGANYRNAIHLHDTRSAEDFRVTDGVADARHPVFDRGGEALIFVASTDLGLAIGWQDLSGVGRPVTRALYRVALKAKPGGAFGIDADGLGSRITALEAEAGNYVDLAAGPAGQVLVQELPIVAPRSGARARGVSVSRVDLKTGKAEPYVSGARSFVVSADGEKAMFRQWRGWAVVPTAAPPKEGEGLLPIDAVEIDTNPRAERRQMYREVWRFQRDYFYDPKLHGLDLKAARARYEPYVERTGRREDLNYLFREMLGDLTVGHMFVGTDGRPEWNGFRGALLGADFTVENGRYRFAKIFDGDTWTSELTAPLRGADVKVGDYLIALDGKELKGTEDIFQRLEGSAGRAVRLTVAATPDGADRREISATPVQDETFLRLETWQEENARRVDELSGGRLAYVHLPDTADLGLASFNRAYFGGVGKAGVVIDGRFNQGGRVADYFIDYMARPLRSCVATREGTGWCTPTVQVYGPKTMIINDQAGSGGDILPWMFRNAGLGPLVGLRTWGGLTAGGAPTLIDGDGVSAPSHGQYSLDGRWPIENVGVAPDYEVENDPASVAAGRDPQLETAVRLTLKALNAKPQGPPRPPPFPSYRRP